MNDLFKGILFWGIAGLLAWFYYSMFVNTKSKVGFIDSDQTPYRKGNGTVVEKQITQTGYELRFTYPEEDNSFRGVLIVSRKEFDRSQIGDKIPVLYGIHLPSLWMPIASGKVYYIGITVMAITIALFLTGAFYIYRVIL